MPVMIGDIDLWLPPRIRSLWDGFKLEFRKAFMKVFSRSERKH